MTETKPSPHAPSPILATILRVGLGLVFIIGGWNKLYQLLDPTMVDGILASYTGPRGYINAFFAEFLFTNGPFTPWGFLTTLSAFEFFSGCALIAGFLVRPLALIYGFLLWSFVVSLPVTISPDAGTSYLAPAALVQARDIGLSGMMFALFILGAGKYALDGKLFNPAARPANWQNLGLLLRLCVALPLIVGGAFVGMADIKTFGMPGWLLFTSGALLISGIGVRLSAGLFFAMLVYYISTKLSLDKSFISNLNGIKRELAYLAACSVLVIAGGGSKFTLQDILWQIKTALKRPSKPTIEYT